MINLIDAISLQLVHAIRDDPGEAHYHLDTPPIGSPRPIMEEANFHLVDRNIAMTQIGFDYYQNIVTYRV